MISILIPQLQWPAPFPQRWEFDLLSALIGAVAALLLAGLAYRFRDILRRYGEGLLAPLAQLYSLLQVGAVGDYLSQVARRASATAVPVPGVLLERLFVAPELVSLVPLQPSDTDAESVISTCPTFPPRRLFSGPPRLAVLGENGAGKSALLAYIALACARPEDGGLAGIVPEEVRKRLPLYVSLASVEWDKVAPPVDRLVDAAIACVEADKSVSNTLRRFLKAGQAVVLVDGWEEIDSSQRAQAVLWLTELSTTLPGNLWVVAAGARGYAPLVEAGFVPLKLAAWDARRAEQLARKCMETFLPPDEFKPATLRRLVALLRDGVYKGVPPLELVLRAYVYLSDGNVPAGRVALYDRVLELTLGREKEPWLLTVCRVVLGQVALSMLQNKRSAVSREELEAAITAALPPLEEASARRGVSSVWRALTGKEGLLRKAGADRYSFVHPLWQAYLAARQMVAIPSPGLGERLDDPAWAETLRFYAEVGDMGPLVAEWLRAPDDLFRSRLRTLGGWVGAAPDGATWATHAMAVLARAFLQAGQSPVLRRQLAQALAVAGIPGITYLFKQALQHPDAGVRAAAALGLGRVAGEADLPVLEAVLRDRDPAVREMAVRGLAFPGTDAARKLLERIVEAGDERLSPIAAEVLVEYGEEGAEFLRSAATAEDAMVRRAAVIGLARLGERELLTRIAREDEQWIVRSAAQTAIEIAEQEEDTLGPAPLPDPAQLGWLIAWAASRGEGVGLGQAAHQMLLRAATEGDTAVRIAAAHTLACIGRPEDVEPLRSALSHSDPEVIEAVLEALAEIGRRYELKIG
ncbi:MAG: HEAT repeat domain-containing protein [Anaerolineae bacterium]|nr:HEAT repeat domain-containing protein [Anaerolineae bacterium]